MGVLFVISREVLAELGGTDAAREMMAALKAGDFVCTVCQQSGWLDLHSPAVVVVLSGALTVVRLAHPGCSRSTVLRAEVTPSGDAGLLARGLMRDQPGGPQPVLLIAPLFSTHGVSAGGEVSDGITGGLIGAGFALVVDITMPVPLVAGLVVRRRRDSLAVQMPDGLALFDGAWSDDPVWDQAAAGGRRVLVVWASGLRVDNPDRDTIHDLVTAIRHGHVVAALGRYVTNG